tara:strand:+ start:282 stop:704 length:423 start_codon:yes stop_codon:yes gene_type:complete
MEWFYENSKIESIQDMPEGVFGFVYEVHHVVSGKKYIGKKQIMSNRTLPPLKGERKKRKVTKESDWQNYYGSQIEVKQLVKEAESLQEFDRRILRYCFTKKELTYRELEHQVLKRVLEDDNYLNSNINGKFFRKDLITEK